MVISFKFKHLLSAIILTGISSLPCVAATDAKKNKNQAPTATAEEAKIRHWSVPEIEKNFWDIPELDEAYIDVTPDDRADGLAVGQLGVDGGKKALIMELAQEITDGAHSEVDSLLIAHKGKVLFESYYSRGRIDLSHPQSSTTKSYTGLAIGRAIQLGYLSMTDLNKPVITFLKGLNHSKFVKGIEKITLKHALTMSSGIQISAEKLEEYRKNPEQYAGIKQIQAYFEDSAPIEDQSFNYQGLNTIMLMNVLEAVVPGSAEDFIKKELFDKLGITNYDWRTDHSGLPVADSNSSMTSRNMIILGSLVMNKGNWQGEQLLPEAFISKATSRTVRLKEEQTQNFYSGDKLSNSGYGYFWWQTDMKVGDKNYSTKSAQGGGGVTILVIDELDLVVVVTAHSRQAYLQMVAEKVLPAFI